MRRLAKDVPEAFTNYVRDANLRIGEAQARALEDTMKFYEDPNLDISIVQTQVMMMMMISLLSRYR